MSRLSRRGFLKFGLASGGSLLLGVVFKSGKTHAGIVTTDEGAFRPNVWIQINSNNTVVLTVTDIEMGQGVKTSLPMLIAEELEVDWKSIQLVQAEPGLDFSGLGTGGSLSIRDNWQVLRKAGATAREMLISSAAQYWNISTNNCYAQNSEVINNITKDKISYGKLAERAAVQPVPENIPLKRPEDWKIIGQSVAMIDGEERASGKARFGIDFQLDGMVYATIIHCPVFGGKVKSIDDSEALKISGVMKVIILSTGVAVIANNTWTAMKAAKVVRIQWADSAFSKEEDRTIKQQYLSAMNSTAETVFETGTIFGETQGREINAIYEVPYQAHMTMEPMNCTVHLHDGICEIWVPTQAPTGVQYQAKKRALSEFDRFVNRIRVRLGFEGDSRQIKVHPQLIGGGFGRRLKHDYVIEAIEIAKTVSRPVKLVWTREEDMQHDFYRPYSIHKLSAQMNTEGKPLSWLHHIVAGDRGRSIGGSMDNIYRIPSVIVKYSDQKNNVPTGSWRSVGHSHNVFVIESFIDELADVAGVDPLQYRLDLLNTEPRCQQVLQKVANMSDWQNRNKVHRHLGISVMKGFGSYVAQVAEVEKQPAGFKVNHVYCAVDCGTVVNPDTVVAQMEGGIIFALTAAIKSRVRIKNGRVVQSNFHDMPLLNIKETPEISVEIISSGDAPGGVGEVGVPCLAAALANAIYTLTGKRERGLWFE